eukprot:359690-Chlamydomonas_euryale.AAC.2
MPRHNFAPAHCCAQYVCPTPGCFGTMAPVNPEVWPDEHAYVYVCNVCAGTRTGTDFLNELEQEHAHHEAHARHHHHEHTHDDMD